MRAAALLSTVLLAALPVIAGDDKPPKPSWPEKGFPVFISRDLLPDHGDQSPRATFPLNQPDKVRIDSAPVMPGVGVTPRTAMLSACEPAEARSVRRSSLRVRWGGDSPATSTLTGDWRPIVHRTREECLEVLKRSRKPR